MDRDPARARWHIGAIKRNGREINAMASLDEDRIRDLIGDFRKDHAELLRKVEGLEQVLTRVAEARGHRLERTCRTGGS